MKRLLSLSLAASIAAVAVCLCLLIRSAQRTVEALPAQLDARLAAEAEATRRAARLEIAELRMALDNQLSALRRDARTVARDGLELSDARAASVQADAALIANRAIAQHDLHMKRLLEIADSQATALRADLRPTLANVEALTAHVDDTVVAARDAMPAVRNIAEHSSETADLILDCESNPGCLANRYFGIAKQGEATLRNTTKITNRMASPFRWLWRGVRYVVPFI